MARNPASIGLVCDFSRRRGRRILEPAQKRVHHRGIDLENFVRHQTVRFIVRALDGFAIRRLDQAERRAAHFVEPVGEKLDVVFILERQILLVRVRDRVPGRAFDVMAVHVHRHISPPSPETPPLESRKYPSAIISGAVIDGHHKLHHPSVLYTRSLTPDRAPVASLHPRRTRIRLCL